jgi:pyruvate dehydrogenase E2 component (dihydrolipoamide acetyltransferase)
VRQLAKKLNVALESVTGTGPGGRIRPEDVEKAGAGGGTAAPAASGPEERVPLRGLRKRIAEHMRRSLSTAASFTFVAECDMTAIVAHRASLKARAQQDGVKLTYMAYIVKALVQPLKEFPLLNASLDEASAEIVLKRYYHVGIATDTPDGLTVPILHDADRMPLFQVAREIERLAAAARNHKLTLEELHNGTFTVTSTGAKGGLLATPILHHPQVAILGVHEIKPKPAVVDGKVVARDMTNLSLSLDHRVVDGAVGADFLYAVIERLQQPAAWLGEGAIA